MGLGLVQFLDNCNIDFVHITYLQNVNANVTADQIAGTGKESLCVSKIGFASASVFVFILFKDICQRSLVLQGKIINNFNFFTEQRCF